MATILTLKNKSKHAEILEYLQRFPDLNVQQQLLQSKNKLSETSCSSEICITGATDVINLTELSQHPNIDTIHTSDNGYPLLARKTGDKKYYGFYYQDLPFFQDSFHIFAGLNAVDTPNSVEKIFKVLQQNKLHCTRMGAFKPRTNPYSFQGLGASCLPYVFELAGKYDIRIIAMEITHESQVELIDTELNKLNYPTGVLLQVGTRNAQNFELLKALGKQTRYPILYKRGYGITLNESLTACEYLCKYGNNKIIFCLRGVKSLFSEPHRNLVDFAQVPVIKRLTKMPVCIDPSHSVGLNAQDLDGIPDIFHATAQGIISGANMLLVDVHETPQQALVDNKQAIALEDFSWYLEDIQINRNCLAQRLKQSRT